MDAARAPRERLGREDHLQQPGREALLDRLAVGRHQTGVVRGQPCFEAQAKLTVPMPRWELLDTKKKVALGDGCTGS